MPDTVWLLLQLDDPYIAPYTAGVYLTEADAEKAVEDDPTLFRFQGMLKEVTIGERCDVCDW